VFFFLFFLSLNVSVVAFLVNDDYGCTWLSSIQYSHAFISFTEKTCFGYFVDQSLYCRSGIGNSRTLGTAKAFLHLNGTIVTTWYMVVEFLKFCHQFLYIFLFLFFGFCRKIYSIAIAVCEMHDFLKVWRENVSYHLLWATPYGRFGLALAKNSSGGLRKCQACSVALIHVV